MGNADQGSIKTLSVNLQERERENILVHEKYKNIHILWTCNVLTQNPWK